MPHLAFGFLLVALPALRGASVPTGVPGDCPLSLSWSNYSTIAAACSDSNDRTICCRYINAFISVSVALHANSTGLLGVPDSLSSNCLSTVSNTLITNGISPNASSFCGLGTKVQVSYQCEGRKTILDMLQSPNFDDVATSCNVLLPDDNGCKKCLNSGLSFLRHLIGSSDNITLNTCRDATFVALANQGDNISAMALASCFFNVRGLHLHPDNPSESPSPQIVPAASPSLLSHQAPSQKLPLPFNHRSRVLSLVPIAGIATVGLAVLLLLILGVQIWRKKRQLRKTEGGNQVNSQADSLHFNTRKCTEGVAPIFCRFSYKEIKRTTENFSSIVGQGGNGIIYRGQLSDGSLVAVKCLKNLSREKECDFIRDMELLGRLHHRHLVALKGFCFRKDSRFMVYEYMENGSLKDLLHSSGKPPLSWQTRIQIAVDVANALEYLHFYCDPPLIHRDVKTSNVFLDKTFVAKVANLRLGHSTRSGDTKKIQGTPGYMDPEYVQTQQLTPKSDVYSYGVLLLELVTGKFAVQGNKNLVEWFRGLLSGDCKLCELVDPNISDSVASEELQVVAETILRCTQKDGQERPSMKQVLRMLYERLDPSHRSFAQAVDDEEAYYYTKEKASQEDQRYDTIPFSSDWRYLHSSSSTSRSHRSRSVLLDSNSPESPHGIFPL